ncbi:MAG TPA: ATP-binding cassette domain-containing protein [Clostridia bacterium]|nr:ATP-binding cassette domain-containing protein [Clostridia bacterium]
MILNESRVLIRTEKLSKSYKLGNEMKVAVREVDIKIVQGEFVIIEGLRGLQKNVFVNLMGCLERPTVGKYYFDYEDIALAKEGILDDIRKLKLGYLFRDFNLIARLTAAQNIEVLLQGLNISQAEKRDRLQKTLKRFDIESIAEKKVSELTDYQKQLVSLARAVVNSPLMIIADEPAANLNSKEEKELMEHLLRLNSEGIAIMLITENTELKASNRFRLISFQDGRISEDKEVQKLSLVRREA